MNSTRNAARLLAVVFSVLLVTSAAGAGALSVVGTAQAQEASDVLYRVNAGGSVSATDGGQDWESDSAYLAGGNSQTSSNPAPDSLDASVPDGTPAGVWTNERYDPPTDGEMQYEFDVPSGQQVEVRLYFYDGYAETSAVGDRVFDVSVEDQTVENFDPIAEYGDQTGGMASFSVVSDGTIDVDFAHVEQNPQINAIEVVSAEAQPNTLGAPSTVDAGTVLTGDSETDQVTLTNLGGTGDADISIEDASVAGADADEFSAGAPSATTLAPGETASVPVTFAPTDAQPKSATLKVSHNGSNSPVTVDLSGEGASDVPVGFGVSGLGADLGNPTSLDFGPDGRLYVAQQSGEIKAFEIARNGENDYEVTDTEVISAVQNLPNHDDDGSYNPNVDGRQVTGITVEGTASTPVLYATSSDPRIGAGGSHTDSGLDTNSGTVSRLTQTDSGWDHDVLVRGLPRSEENHATNGVQYDAEENVLYLAQGGHTNKGAPSDNFALTPEYALSAAVLSVDLDQLDGMAEKDAAHTDATYIYDLPTLQGTETPFGGQDGANMANWTADGPVDVYSPGYRNAYDIALSEDGELYATDNSANPGWGGIVVNEGPSGECTNAQNEQDEYSAPGVYHIEGEDYYGGHPNPTRGNATSEFAGAVDDGLHDPINCDFIAPTNGSSPSEALETYGATPQGMDVYPASNFGGEMQGDLLLAMWNSGDVERVELNAQGTEATASEPVFQNIGSNPLDVHAQGDDDEFPGTVWAATYGSNAITVFEPNDYGGSAGEQCLGTDPESPDYEPDGDADGDGYTNADENAAGTDPCSQASQPDDWDQDGVPDSVDDDDDGDGLTDDEDPFALDPQNGLDNEMPVDRQFEAGQHPQSLFGLGFTGLMTNGTDYADLYNGSKVRAGGATERFSVDEVPFGDAYEAKNSQSYGFQYGVNATGDAPFTVHTTVESPFSDDMTPENYQAAGMQIGPGDQDNYVKLVAGAQDAESEPNGGVQLLKETDGTVGDSDSVVVSEPDVFGSGQTIDLYLDVYPSNDTVVASYAIDDGERVTFDQTVTMPESWYADDDMGLAVGLISTANGADSTFSASWDRLTVTEIGANAAPTADAGDDQTIDENASVTLDATGSTDADGDELGYSWTQIAGPDVQLSAQDDAAPSFTAPDVDGNETLTFEVTVTDAGGATDSDAVNVTVQGTDQPSDEVVYAVNAGGSAYTAADGTEYQADDYFAGGSTTNVSADYGVTDVGDTDDDALYVTERYGQNGAPVSYSFPVEDGTYEVTVHLAEIWFGTDHGTTGGDGSRVMSANLEGGEVELADYDIHADVGALNATTKTYTVEVTDGELDIDFTSSVENPKVSAIEVAAVDGSADVPSGGEATIEIDDGEGIDATTWDAESFEIANTGEETIETVTLNLSSAVLPDVVFDPDGTAGDQGAKGFVLNDNATSGTVDATVLAPHNGVNGSDGYDTLQIEFGAFEPGESVTFEIDNDPTSIKGGSSVQSGEAGPISGLELSGSEMSVDFADGSTATTDLFGDGSAGGSQATADADVSAAPTLDVANVSLAETTLSPDHAAATVATANQTVTVSGAPGSTVTLLRIEGELNLDGVPDYDGTPGYDVEAYEANTAIQVEEYTATVGEDGTAEIPVTLTNGSATGGLNYFVATADDDEGETGLTSNVAVLEYDQSADTGPDPVGDFENAPTDPDGDGVYEDVNGDGTVTVSDAQALFAHLNDPAVQNDVGAFDVNGDGAVTAGDAQALFADLVGGS
ncbi:malectin domain-containing carbohydrate-binding protein [Halorussus marinus]|uniref:malectin domain-containing carbohydrate-binding protein n=1 Tax=Halorussus marinus TaxID=2505976 RepID=UPI00142F96A5|nr:malectin domain-containing carbohydrate-binding protein [Halorussus marinus]